MPPWLRAHWRPLAAGLALLLAFALGRASVRPPKIEAHETETAQTQTQVHAEAHAESSAAIDQQATSSASLAAHHRVHRTRTVHTLPSGERTAITETTVDDGLTLETAQEVTITLQTASLVLGAIDVSRDTVAARQVDVVQTPEEAPSVRLWGELGAQVGLPPEPYGSAGAGLRIGKVPLVPAQLWLAGEGRFRPAQSPEVRVGLRVELDL